MSFNLAILLHFAVSTVVTKGLKGFKFGGFFQNCQFAKLKHSPIFPAIRYIDIRPFMLAKHEALNLPIAAA